VQGIHFQLHPQIQEFFRLPWILKQVNK
jgi:hypothetical protein